MSMNSFGHLFRFSTWGESHGKAIGVTIDGCPPNIEISESMIQVFMDKRKPGQSKYTTQRKEADTVEILSGTFEGKTTGTPIQIVVQNLDQRSKDYSNIATSFRPGHADITYHKKYGIRDYRGGGRASARETAVRVAAGSVARLVLRKLVPNLDIIGYLVRIGEHEIDRKNFDISTISQNPFWSPDKHTVSKWADYLDKTRKNKNSVGAIIEILAKNVPIGLGSPIYNKLDAQIASAMMSINAVKAVEIGNGIMSASSTGKENADEIRINDNNEPVFLSNNAGGILGGISTGQDIVTRFAVKPTSSIATSKLSIDESGDEVEVITKGRHDPCVGIRAVPVGEAMMACVLLDQYLINRGQIG
ncbi:MAG: chorismate synthase [Rhodobacteraceae bacterium]|nr:MAG: chorismate synthase [Paracoccaceae bacterium]